MSNTSSTLERLAGFRVLVPLKITSCMDSPRSSEALLSPSTQRTASMMLDLPQPLGPTTPINWPGSTKLVGSANDLKPDNLIELRRTANPVFFLSQVVDLMQLFAMRTHKREAVREPVMLPDAQSAKGLEGAM